MVSAFPVKRDLPLIDPASAPRYDFVDPYPDEGDLLELPGPRSRYEQLAAQIRAGIYDGTYAPDSALPAEPVLAGKHGMSRALVNRALQLLGDEELVSQEQGRGTYVRRRRVYRVGVEVPRPGGVAVPEGRDALLGAVRDAAAAEPAVTVVESAVLEAACARISLLAEAADGDWAVHAAKLVTRSAGGAWTWEGWDLTLAAYRVQPA